MQTLAWSLVGTSKASGKLGIPALLLFLVIGMLAGSDGIGGLWFDDPYLAQALGVVALVLILLAGGMDTDWKVVRPVSSQAVSLWTVGVLITAFLVGWFSTTLLGFSFLEGLVLGAVVASTDAAAVLAVLRSRNIGLKGQLKPLLELESGSNDPMAVFMTNSDIIHKRSLLRFHDGLAWLMQIAMFLTLGLLVFPSRLVLVTGVGLLLAFFLMFIARPVSVFVALAFFKMDVREKAMVAWVGLRGAVPIILATFPLLAGLPKAEYIFNLVFFIVFASVLFQGTSLPRVARWLGVEEPLSAPYHYPLEFVPAVNSSCQLVELMVPSRSPAAGKSIVELQLPRGALFVSV